MRKWVDLCFVSVILFVAGCRLRTPLCDMFGKNVSIPVSLNSLWFPLQKTCAGCVSLEKVSYETAVGFVLDKPDLRCSNVLNYEYLHGFVDCCGMLSEDGGKTFIHAAVENWKEIKVAMVVPFDNGFYLVKYFTKKDMGEGMTSRYLFFSKDGFYAYAVPPQLRMFAHGAYCDGRYISDGYARLDGVEKRVLLFSECRRIGRDVVHGLSVRSGYATINGYKYEMSIDDFRSEGDFIVASATFFSCLSNEPWPYGFRHNGILVSRDGGHNWHIKRLFESKPPPCICINATGKIVANLDREFLVSDDFGETWRSLPLDHTGKGFSSLAFSGARIIACMEHSDIVYNHREADYCVYDAESLKVISLRRDFSFTKDDILKDETLSEEARNLILDAIVRRDFHERLNRHESR